jgi:rod shape-determining protein MreD
MTLVVKNLLRFLLILFVQVYILNRIPPLHQFIVPYFYFVFILWLPFKTSKTTLLFVAFGVGFVVDIFYKTPGLHAAAVLLIAYLRPFLINLLLPKEAIEWGSEEPSQNNMGAMPYYTYVILLTLFHNAYLIFLEWISFGSITYFFGKLIGTSLISLLLIVVADLLGARKSKAR